MNFIEIIVNKKTRKVSFNKSNLGNEGENLQEKLVFSFDDEFVNGQARLEYCVDEDKKCIFLEKKENSYQTPIFASMLKNNRINMQLVITQGETDDEIPIFKSSVFNMYCNRSINAEIEAQTEPLSWLEIANTKLNQIDNVDIDIETKDDATKVIIKNKNGETKEAVVSGGSGGTSNYNDLKNLPTINGVEIKENLTTEELGILDDVKTYIDENKDQLKGADGYTPVKGVDYFDGVDGKDGYTPIKGKDYFDGKDGTNGLDGYTPVKGKDYFDGADGKDGYTPIKGVDYFDGKDGANGVDGYTPIKGNDYYTEADKQEMVNLILEALPSSEEVSY